MAVSDELRSEVRFRALELALSQGHSLIDEEALAETVDRFTAIVLGPLDSSDPADEPVAETDKKSGNPKGGK